MGSGPTEPGLMGSGPTEPGLMGSVPTEPGLTPSLCLRYTASSSFRAADDRPLYGSSSRLHDPPTRRGSTGQLDGSVQSRHSSTRDLAGTAHGNGIHRVREQDGGTA